MSITLELKDLISILLLLIALYLAFRLIEQKWSYKISKPHKWEAAVRAGSVSSALRKMERTYRDKVRFYTIWFQIERLKEQEIQGVFAELGVYKGETAQFIHEMDPSRDFHLFDTFTGFETHDLKHEESTDTKFSEDNFSDTSLDEVKARIGESDKIHFHVGFFPDTTNELMDNAYALVHLDADLYAPTLSALNYFYPRLANGGIILIHDYNHTWSGLRQAVDEFLSTNQVTLIEIADWQGSVMLAKNR